MFLASELSVTDLHGCVCVRNSRVNLAAVQNSCLKGSNFANRQVIKHFAEQLSEAIIGLYNLPTISHTSVAQCGSFAVRNEKSCTILSFSVFR